MGRGIGSPVGFSHCEYLSHGVIHTSVTGRSIRITPNRDGSARFSLVIKRMASFELKLSGAEPEGWSVCPERTSTSSCWS